MVDRSGIANIAPQAFLLNPKQADFVQGKASRPTFQIMPRRVDKIAVAIVLGMFGLVVIVGSVAALASRLRMAVSGNRAVGTIYNKSVLNNRSEYQLKATTLGDI